MTLESRGGTFLDGMLRNQREEHFRRPFDFEVIETYIGPLTVFTRPIESIPGVSDVTGDVVYGCLGDKVIFHRDRRKILRGEESRFELIQWFLLLEGPLVDIRYLNGWDGKNELALGFQVPRIARGRQARYSLANGNFISSDSNWSKELLADPWEGLSLDTVEVPRQDGIHIEGRNGEKVVEEVIFPWQVDLAKWLPVFFDEQDTAVNDPKLPWQDWPRDLGMDFYASLNGQQRT